MVWHSRGMVLLSLLGLRRRREVVEVVVEGHVEVAGRSGRRHWNWPTLGRDDTVKWLGAGPG